MSNEDSNGLESLSPKEKFAGGEWWVGGRPNLMYSPGPGLWSLVLGSFRPDLGPDLGPGPGPELDNIYSGEYHQSVCVEDLMVRAKSGCQLNSSC